MTDQFNITNARNTIERLVTERQALDGAANLILTLEKAGAALAQKNAEIDAAAVRLSELNAALALAEQSIEDKKALAKQIDASAKADADVIRAEARKEAAEVQAQAKALADAAEQAREAVAVYNKQVDTAKAELEQLQESIRAAKAKAAADLGL
jgi:chromosome segregation ATPase